MLDGAPSEECIEIFVAANGCDDKTVEMARSASATATILDLQVGSKTKAINAAHRLSNTYPKIVLDADVECSFRSLSALAEALRQPGVMVAAPSIRVDLARGNRFIRAYYRAWLKQPFAKTGKGGSGCYGLSKAALDEIKEFPDIIGDDLWIHTRFPDVQRQYVHTDTSGKSVFSVVRPPRTVWNQVEVEVRRRLGNVEVQDNFPSPYLSAVKNEGGLKGALKSGASLQDLLVFLFVKLIVRFRTANALKSGGKIAWARDDSSRLE